MTAPPKPSLTHRLKCLFIGDARSPTDRTIFHKLSLIPLFAWVGLGADALSSSSYGPEEAFLALHGHTYLAIFVALGTALTIFIISGSYSQIIELFPAGGGGYLVASKLLSPGIGMISGCALLIDYVLTITVSIASSANAIFSFLPAEWHSFRLWFAIAGILVLILLNLRGVKESVVPLAPIFILFVVTHLVIIAYALATHFTGLPIVVDNTVAEVREVSLESGFFGLLFLIMRAYSMGAGTYTGIEAVSNGMPILREPRVETGRRTMQYMAISLIFMVLGLMFAYLLYEVSSQPGKTLNAVLFESITRGWGNAGYYFVVVILISEAALLFVGAQTGFLDGPRVLANMAADRWLPTRFAMLSDRLVTHNGILIIGGAALAMMILTNGAVGFLVVLYSIHVFITFALSQAGMVRHWWNSRAKVNGWQKKILINGVGLIMTLFILIFVTAVKFESGGWTTFIVLGGLIAIAIFIRRHYDGTYKLLCKLDYLVQEAETTGLPGIKQNGVPNKTFDPKAKTAVLLVNGYNGLGLHSLSSISKLFSGAFKNFVFVQVGVVDAGVFKGAEEIERLQAKTKSEVDHYVNLVKRYGYYAEAISPIGTDVVEEIAKIAPSTLERFPNAVFFGGQIVFPEDTVFTHALHNFTVFSLQKRFYRQGVPFILLPFKVNESD